MLDYIFLKSVIEEENKVLCKKIDDSFLLEKGASLAHSFIIDNIEKFDSFPKWETVVSECKLEPSLVELESKEKAAFYFEKIDNRKLSLLIKEKLNPIASLVKSDPYEALKQYREQIRVLSKVHSDAKGTLMDWTDPVESQKRIDRFEEREKNKGKLLGIPTPWPSINIATNGIQEGQFWVFVAKLKTGKSWTIGPALVMDMVRQGYRVLVIPPELTIESYSNRFDSAVSKVPYGSFIKGDITHDQKTRFVSTLMSLDTSFSGKLWLAGDGLVKTVAHIEELYDRLEPDIIVLDGLYLVKPSGKYNVTDKHKSVVKVVEEIKDFVSKTKVRFVASHQFNRKAEEAEDLGGSSKHVGSAYEIPQYVDVLIGLYRSPLLFKNKKMAMKIIELRDGEKCNIVSHFDLFNMDFSEVCTFEGDSVEEVDIEDLMAKPIIEDNIQDEFLSKEEIFSEEITSFNIDE